MSDTEFLHKAINSAKNFENFQDVLMAVSLHPEWLTSIPEGRAWAILHQIILSGDVNHLNQLLVLQKSNKNFRLLTNTKDGKTVLQVASLRNDAPDMTKRVQQLVKLDEMLSYAYDCVWDRCYEIAKENPSFVNEKPPYRRFYLIHHMACANAIEQFERFKQIKDCKFDLNLQADQKKINVIAREQNRPEFAAYMEQQCPFLLNDDSSSLDDANKPSEEAVKQTDAINTLMAQKSIVKALDRDLMGEPPKPKTRDEIVQHIAGLRTAHSDDQNKKSDAVVKAEEDKRQELILDILTCPLTLCTFIEPGKYYYYFEKRQKTIFCLVVAADGCTYEKSSIVNWLKTNDRSPLTNELLANKELQPNTVVIQIIKALQLPS
jgi:hypothetical protein